MIAAEPDPIPNQNDPVWDLVIADMRARDRHGREFYGTPLQPWNGRNSLIDAYQEALDLVVYLRQALIDQTLLGEVRQLAEQIGEFGDRTFTQSTPQSVLAHLRREVDECQAASNPADRLKEKADVIILVHHLYWKLGIDPYSAHTVQAVRDKFAVLLKRKWGEPDAEGVVEHIEEATDGQSE